MDTSHGQSIEAAWTAATARAATRLAGLSHEDKVAIGLADFDRVTDPDVVPYRYSDGPNGVRDAKGATVFPSSLALAATFDRALAAEYGGVLAGEMLAAGKNALLGPAFDVARVPESGRAGENMGEDPVLIGEIGGAVVASLQAGGVLAVAKHFVANNFEWLRTGAGFPERSDAMDVHVDARTLADVYLEPFRRAIGHGAAALMGSYNRLNGVYACERADLLALPREQWGWQGVMTPDFKFAVRDPGAALVAGMDIPGLDGAAGRTAEQLLADPERLDDVVLHILAAAEFVGLRRPHADAAGLGGPEALGLAERIAADGMVLLKNEDALLPLAAGTKVAVIGAESVAELLVIGGSAAVVVTPERTVPVADALGARFAVSSSPGSDGVVPLPPLAASRTVDGIHVALVDAATGDARGSEPAVFRIDPPADVRSGWSATVETRIVPTIGGRHVFALEFAGEAVLYVDGAEVASGFREASPFVVGPLLPLFAVVDLEAGRPVDLRVEYVSGVAISIPIPGFEMDPHLELGWSEPGGSIAAAAALAADADVALVVVGRVSAEGMDTDGLGSPGLQDDLVAAVAAANPATVVVTLGSGPVVMPWLDRVPAVLHGWFPGERFGEALAAVLSGDAEPGGRLVLTWPKAEDRTPIESAAQYPGVDGVVEYTEGSLVGYRWYDAEGVSPRFPFGHGLGYAAVEFGEPAVSVGAASIVVTVDAQNAGEVRGKAVPQLYVSHPADAGAPPRQLVAFDAVRLAPGETRTLRFEIPLEDLWRADDAGRRRAVPGTYTITVGRSSRDVTGAADFDLA